ncbi:MAG TPA: Crp/Fnr family transcriptional regulator [Pseudolabrys sp.]|nr:Crp/Fnr family transcriptional regulator [Pseudolabrys sp.]
MIDRALAREPSPPNRIAQIFWRAGKDNVIRNGDKNYLSGPFVLCKGWAYRFYRLPDGRRQILSVLIPGDLFSAAALLAPDSDFSVQAATDIEFCQLAHDDVRQNLASEPAIRDALGRSCSAEMDEAISTSIALNHSDAALRIASFAHRLTRRMLARQISIEADVYPFHLTPVDIADATGLTPDDVNRALQKLQQSSILNIASDRITIIDAAKLDGFIGSYSTI